MPLYTQYGIVRIPSTAPTGDAGLDISNNFVAIADAITANTSTLVSHTSSIATNTTAIANNTTAIGTNTTAIAANTTAIALRAPIANPVFTGTLTAAIINGNSSTGLTLNGNSSTGVIIAGDASPVAINGTTKINNKALTIAYAPTGGVSPFQIVDGSNNNLMSIINYTTTNNAMVMSGKVIAQVSGSTAYFNNDPTVTTIFRGIKTTFGDATNPYALSSGVDNCVTISPNYKQSGTAGGTDLLINRIQTGTGYAVGSGPQKLIDAQVDSVSKFSIDNTGKSIFRGDMQVYGSTTNVGNQYPLIVQDSSANNLFLFNSYGATNNRILIGGYSAFQQVGSTTYLAPDNTGNLQLGSPIIATQSMTVAGNAGFGTTTPRWMVSLGSTLSNTKLALYDNNTGTAFYGFGVQSGYVVATANDVQCVYFSANAGGSLGVHQSSPQTYLDIAGAVAPAAVGVEDMLYLTKPTQGGVSYLEMAGFSLGRWATTGAFEPKSRLDIKLKDVASSTAVPEVTVMTLQSNGNVGIGTTLPSTLLQVAGTATISGTYSATTGATDRPFIVNPTYAQTGSASATDITINRNTVVGSGTQYFIDAQISGVSKTTLDTNGTLQTPIVTTTTSLKTDTIANRVGTFVNTPPMKMSYMIFSSVMQWTSTSGTPYTPSGVQSGLINVNGATAFSVNYVNNGTYVANVIYTIKNTGAGVVTLAWTSTNIDNVSGGTKTLASMATIRVYWDGSNWWTL